MNSTPLVSVCINCYNAENTIEATLRSVLDQTYRNLQVIVVDDCSTDNTRQILQRLDDDRIECVYLAENGHISNANNEALRHVRGEYVAHLDADDRWVPDKIEKQLTFLQEHPEYGACFSIAEMVDEQGDPVDDHRYRAENRDRTAMLRHLITVGNYLNHSSMFARREIIDRVGEHNPTLLYFHDYDYWIRMSMHCDIYIFSEKLLYCRLSANSNSAMQEQKQNGHVYEFAQIMYDSLLSCPDELFLEAFADRLRLQGEHTPAQTALEKAFLLNDLLIYMPQNPALGLRRLSELLQDKSYATIAARDFGFTVHQLYALAQTPVYHDAAAHRTLIERAAALEQTCEALSTERDLFRAELAGTREYLDSVLADREDLRAHIQQLAADRAAQEARAALAEQRLALAHGSLSWKITKPLRAFKRLFRR